jgi:hypothetical protein
MKSIYQLLLVAALFASTTSCQKVINVSLNSAAQKYVIEGEINDGPGPYTISITRTRPFSEDNTFERISGAQVTIADLTAGTVDSLKSDGPGNYRTSMLTGVPGHAYKLSVMVSGQAYEALSTMPSQAVGIDTLYVKRSDFGGDSYFATPEFTDPVGKGNYYRLRQWVKDTLIDGSRLRSDDATDGQTYRSPLYYDNGKDSGNPKILNGDSIKVELQCLNRQVYDYYRTLRDVTGQNSATPANPLTNVTGGALGIFNTCTSRKRAAVAVY